MAYEFCLLSILHMVRTRPTDAGTIKTIDKLVMGTLPIASIKAALIPGEKDD